MPQVKFEGTVQRRGGSLQATIPKPLCDAFDIKSGTVLISYADGDKIIIEKKED